MKVLGQQVCPVAKTAEIISSKWTLLIIRDLADRQRRFHELQDSLAGISPKTLSERLRTLQRSGMVDRQCFAEVPPRVEYSLTEKGRDLVSIVDSMRRYGSKWLL